VEDDDKPAGGKAKGKAAKGADSEPKGKGKGKSSGAGGADNGEGGGKKSKAKISEEAYDDDAAEKQKPSRKVGAKANGQAASRTSSTTMGAMTDDLFEDLEDVSPLTRQAISEVFEYVNMTKVQAMTVEPCLSGCDVVAKAKTGTGKTLGFLIPAVEMGLVRKQPSKGHVAVLCLSPTRELAQQTAEEAKALLTFHSKAFGVQCVVGGTNMKSEQSALKRSPPPSVLVATPGRLNDHLENSGLADLCKALRVLVFDEADQLLDMGFRPAIEKVLSFLPSKETRQTLLFSATFPQQVNAIAQTALRCTGKGKYQMIDTIGDEEVPTHKIPQSYLMTSIEEQMPAVMCALAQQAKKSDHKVIVFLPTARQTQLFAEVFNALVDLRVFKAKCLEIHSRKSQPQRTRASDEFRNASKAILFSSDVSARGMDYPDVTFVLQCGAPSDKAQYVHRLGRTARAGKSGCGLLVLADFEKFFIQQIKDLPIKQEKPTDRAELDKMWYSTEDALKNAHRANPQLGGQAYQAWMGFYNSYLGKLHWTKEQLVSQANYYAVECMKLSGPPPLEPKTVGKMGLKGTPGLVIERRPPK
jgi:ATP-dependent RNA helicase MSS116